MVAEASTKGAVLAARHAPKLRARATNSALVAPNTGVCSPSGITHNAASGIPRYRRSATSTGYSGSRSPLTINVRARMLASSSALTWASSWPLANVQGVERAEDGSLRPRARRELVVPFAPGKTTLLPVVLSAAF